MVVCPLCCASVLLLIVLFAPVVWCLILVVRCAFLFAQQFSPILDRSINHHLPVERPMGHQWFGWSRVDVISYSVLVIATSLDPATVLTLFVGRNELLRILLFSYMFGVLS